jgi:hypothetical protein
MNLTDTIFMLDTDKKDAGTDLEAEIHEPAGSVSVPEKKVNGELNAVMESTGNGVKASSEVVPPNAERLLEPRLQKFFLLSLETRFHNQHELHKDIRWADVAAALLADPEKIWSLNKMDRTGGEPDLIDEIDGKFIFGDCSSESPSGRRNVAYDKEGEELFRKEFPDIKIVGNACDMAANWQVDLIPEYAYRWLQKSIEIDDKTLSWIETPDWFRKTGYAMFGHLDKGQGCWGKVTVGSCGESLGFRAVLRVKKI